MTHLDGNALAGTLVDALGADLTDRSARCAHCGTTAVVATCLVYVSPMGVVARCATCDAVLVTVVESQDGRRWFGMPGVAAVEIPASH
ncbi:DUF6510 family protein [Microbacterium sp. P01]|uniref:DUF6510 family protein n=1 Tax=unclassified Microbacterium TaxID=2609290 RepID=UPI00366FB3DF